MQQRWQASQRITSTGGVYKKWRDKQMSNSVEYFKVVKIQ